MLCEAVGETANLDSSKELIEWGHHKVEDILTYRDKTFASIFTGKVAPKREKVWMTEGEGVREKEPEYP